MKSTSTGGLAARGKTVLIGGLIVASLSAPLGSAACATPLVVPLYDTGAGGGVVADLREQPDLDLFERRMPE